MEPINWPKYNVSNHRQAPFNLARHVQYSDSDNDLIEKTNFLRRLCSDSNGLQKLRAESSNSSYAQDLPMCNIQFDWGTQITPYYPKDYHLPGVCFSYCPLVPLTSLSAGGWKLGFSIINNPNQPRGIKNYMTKSDGKGSTMSFFMEPNKAVLSEDPSTSIKREFEGTFRVSSRQEIVEGGLEIYRTYSASISANFMTFGTFSQGNELFFKVNSAKLSRSDRSGDVLFQERSVKFELPPYSSGIYTLKDASSPELNGFNVTGKSLRKTKHLRASDDVSLSDLVVSEVFPRNIPGRREVETIQTMKAMLDLFKQGDPSKFAGFNWVYFDR